MVVDSEIVAIMMTVLAVLPQWVVCLRVVYLHPDLILLQTMVSTILQQMHRLHGKISAPEASDAVFRLPAFEREYRIRSSIRH